MVVAKVSMTRVEPFGKVAERFASQQGTRFSVRFPQAFITSLFQAFQKGVKSPPSADKIEPFPKPYSYRGNTVSPPSSEVILVQLRVIWNIN
ncbi:hypothetical protein AVEN_49150-1 [Araneus ventricosus]|uniref:Uncharacterized protein n=1 Tax=Araneus ventricosus TaxID=182803 RepID=A0A4Y2C000_ARAVE|nr:hypothetical protein AVEN_49150-1 [Araneus ventricosus]